jgi:hypothetical protein
MQAVYVVHPNALLKTWVLLLRLQEPEFYGKVWLPTGCLPFIVLVQEYVLRMVNWMSSKA